VSGTRGYIRVTFPESLEFTAVPLVIEEQLRAYSHGFTGAEVRVSARVRRSTVAGRRGAELPDHAARVQLRATRDIAEDLGTRLSRHSRVHDVDTNASGGGFMRDRASPEFVVDVDRDAASRHD
jgi:hypothetical protein